jgi:transcriptional regulator with XRE-family HTH domain
MPDKAVKKNTRGRGRGRSEDGSPNPVDIHVGSRVRLRRTLLGLSQEKLGDEIGLTFQQVQKYERGANRVGASRLYDLSRVLDVPVSFFFDDMPAEVERATPAERKELVSSPDEDDPMHRRETLEMVRAYYRISSIERRKKVFELIKAMAADWHTAEVLG